MKVTIKLAVLALTVALVLPAGAGAVLSGTNGRIVFTSGRTGGDAEAKLFMRTMIGSAGGGVAGSAFTPLTGTQHRHPTWSPDRTKVAYARGVPGNPMTENYDIYVHDLVADTITPITDTGDSLSADRPAWSPDGTRIAYEHQPIDNGVDRDIRVQSLVGGPLVNLTLQGVHEGKPAWSPDSQTIYYSSGDIAVNSNILQEPAGGGTATLAVGDSSLSEFQPAISPDGTKICFTIGTGFNATAEVLAGTIGGFYANVSDNLTEGDYNCTWSPDGTLIAYVRGIFSTGDLVMVRGDDTSPSPSILEDTVGVFDGNPDWAPDGRPECGDTTTSTVTGAPVTITLDCADTGPAYEQTPLIVDVTGAEGPTNGTVGAPQGTPAAVTYTPNVGFVGKDTFKVRPRDGAGFSSDRGTITVDVTQQPAGGGGAGGGGAGGGGTGPDPDVTRPSITNVGLSPRKWKRGSALARASATPVGTTIRWSLSEAARVTLTFQKALPGRRVGRACLKPTRARSSKPRCTRFRKAATLTVTGGRSGANSLRFQGRVTARKRLGLGTYRVAIGARDGAGNRASTRYSKTFKVVAR